MAKKIENNTMEQKIDALRNYISNLSPEERTKQDVADKIYETLKNIVDKKNEKAHLYQAEVNRRLQGKINHKWRKALLEEFFWSSDAKEVLKEMFKPENEEIYKEFKQAEKKLEQEEYKKIFEVFKRAYNKSLGVHKGNDIDKKAIHFLLKKSWFFTDQKWKEVFNTIKQEVPHGESVDKWLTVDSWGTVTGLKIENTEKITPKGDLLKTLIGSKAIIDEHGDGSPKSKTTKRPTSSTHMIHTLLRSLNKIPGKEKEQIQRFVDFVDIVDSLEYQASGINYSNQHKTIFGLHHQLPIEEVYKYFENPKHTGFEILSDDQLKSRNIKKTYRKNWRKIEEIQSRKGLAKDQEQKLNKSVEDFAQLDPKRWLSFNGHRFTVLFDKEVEYWPQAAAYNNSGIIKLGVDKETKEPYLYIFNPFEEFTRSIGGIQADGHFIHKKNIDKETLQKVLNEFGYTNDYIFTKLPKKLVRKETMTYIEKNKALPAIDIKKLKIGEVLTGIIKNSNDRMIHIKLWNNVSGVIKKNETTIIPKKWEKINVKVINISASKNDDKTYIELEQIA